MAKFQPGEHANPATEISGEVAVEMQKRSAEARKRNRTLREAALEALMEDGGGGYTRLDHLVRKAMENHRKGKLTFHDLKDLAAILGENVLKVETDGAKLLVVDSETLQAAAKWSSKPEASSKD